MEVEVPLDAPRPWIGKLFFLIGTLWFIGAFLIMRPDLQYGDPQPRPTIKLQDGKEYKVYLPSEVLGEETAWVEKIDFKTKYTASDLYRRPTLRFVLFALGPPALVLFGSLAWLGIAELMALRRYAGRYRD